MAAHWGATGNGPYSQTSGETVSVKLTSYFRDSMGMEVESGAEEVKLLKIGAVPVGFGL
jgi:hypothetical protein